MNTLRIKANRAGIAAEIRRIDPIRGSIETIVAKARALVPANKKEVWEEQAMAIAYIAREVCGPVESPNVLEIGCNRGYSAAILKLAAPHATVTTLEPDPTLRKIARANIVEQTGVVVSSYQSTHYLAATEGSPVQYDLIFVDGDHKNIRKDLPWYNRLRVNGLFLHHDYSPLESARPCPPVFEALNEFADGLAHPADVLIVDETGVGMAGWLRREGESWNPA